MRAYAGILILLVSSCSLASWNQAQAGPEIIDGTPVVPGKFMASQRTWLLAPQIEAEINALGWTIERVAQRRWRDYGAGFFICSFPEDLPVADAVTLAQGIEIEIPWSGELRPAFTDVQPIEYGYELLDGLVCRAHVVGIEFDPEKRDHVVRRMEARGFTPQTPEPYMPGHWRWTASIPLQYALAVAEGIDGVVRAHPQVLLWCPDPPECPGCFMPIAPIGDADHSLDVDILDLVFIRDRLGQDPSSGDNWSADVNNDGVINILDLIYVRSCLGNRFYYGHY
jgi:hypothetical protein